MSELVSVSLWAAVTVVCMLFLSIVKDLRFSKGDWLVPAIGAAAVVEVVVRWSEERAADERRILVAVTLALTLWILRARRPGADAGEGVLTGATIGALASVVETAATGRASTWLYILAVLAGLMTFSWPLRLRRARFAAAIGVAAVVGSLVDPVQAATEGREGLAPWLLGATAGIVLALLLLRWPVIRRELREEAGLGFVPAEDVSWVSNPFSRLFNKDWADQEARREFVRQANELAVQKARQRRLPPDQARLQQLETIRIRMLLQNVLQVELSMRHQARAANDSRSSDKLESKG